MVMAPAKAMPPRPTAPGADALPQLATPNPMMPARTEVSARTSSERMSDVL